MTRSRGRKRVLKMFLLVGGIWWDGLIVVVSQAYRSEAYSDSHCPAAGYEDKRVAGLHRRRAGGWVEGGEGA
jgi:hypothetical protein